MERIIPEEILDYLYKLMNVEMTDFDCGKLCAEDNDETPPCCDISKTVPVLFNDEIAHNEKSAPGFWQPLASNSPALKNLEDVLDPEIECFAECQGPKECKRNARALVCRFYPFEPHCDPCGNVIGLSLNYDEKQCPLIILDGFQPNQQYIDNSIVAWRYLFEIFPDYQELFTEVSQELRESGFDFIIFKESRN